MNWKVCLIVDAANAKHTRDAIESLMAAGFDSINLFAPRGVTLSDGDHLIRHRCERNASEADLFLEAFSSFTRTTSRDIDFVFYARADLNIWSQSKAVLENTIEPDFMGVYFPVSPAPFFEDCSTALPCSKGFGWCETLVDEPVTGSPCIALARHSALLLSFAAERELRSRREGTPCWNYCLASLIRDYVMPCFVHLPSMGHFRDEGQEAISPAARLRPGWEKRNWYLN